MLRSKKGMLGNLIGAVVSIFVGLSLIPVISQQVAIASAGFCGTETPKDINASITPPLGRTDSFGGGGSDYHFGGYDGKVKHANFNPINNYQVMQQNCQGLKGPAKTMLDIFPAIFALTILFIGISFAYNSLRMVGVI